MRPKASPTLRTVHPRACGEHLGSLPPVKALNGSSPRLRGTFGHNTGKGCKGRFIPAPAGNIYGRVCGHELGPVHPRACGEHRRRRHLTPTPYGSSPRLRGTWTAQADALAAHGSSPRLRGTYCNLRAIAQCCRFIPAPAGNIRPHHNRQRI